mmetsp:Transcript_18998/g.38200  ORF Transcript_18998/g.38200 Transcript_18998/m.38200 type:complete len:96 (-) Transcript_18998:357-644(-)
MGSMLTTSIFENPAQCKMFSLHHGTVDMGNIASGTPPNQHRRHQSLSLLQKFQILQEVYLHEPQGRQLLCLPHGTRFILACAQQRLCSRDIRCVV